MRRFQQCFDATLSDNTTALPSRQEAVSKVALPSANEDRPKLPLILFFVLPNIRLRRNSVYGVARRKEGAHKPRVSPPVVVPMHIPRLRVKRPPVNVRSALAELRSVGTISLVDDQSYGEQAVECKAD